MKKCKICGKTMRPTELHIGCGLSALNPLIINSPTRSRTPKRTCPKCGREVISPRKRLCHICRGDK